VLSSFLFPRKTKTTSFSPEVGRRCFPLFPFGFRAAPGLVNWSFFFWVSPFVIGFFFSRACSLRPVLSFFWHESRFIHASQRRGAMFKFQRFNISKRGNRLRADPLFLSFTQLCVKTLFPPSQCQVLGAVDEAAACAYFPFLQGLFLERRPSLFFFRCVERLSPIGMISLFPSLFCCWTFFLGRGAALLVPFQ